MPMDPEELRKLTKEKLMQPALGLSEARADSLIERHQVEHLGWTAAMLSFWLKIMEPSGGHNREIIRALAKFSLGEDNPNMFDALLLRLIGNPIGHMIHYILPEKLEKRRFLKIIDDILQ